MATAFYQWYFEADLIQRSGDLTGSDMLVGLLLIGFVIIAPKGIVGLWRDYIHDRKAARSETIEPVAGAAKAGTH